MYQIMKKTNSSDVLGYDVDRYSKLNKICNNFLARIVPHENETI